MNMLHEPAGLVTGTVAPRLVLVTETWPPEINGVAMTLNRLVQGLLDRGWRVTVVRPRQRSDSNLLAMATVQHLLVPGVPIPGYAGLRFGLPMFEKLRETWKAEPPDVVHIATEGPLGWAPLKAARLLGIPVTSSFHTNFHRYCRHYRMTWLRGLVSRHLRRFHNQTAFTMVPNQFVRETLQNDGYRNVVVLGRGIDTGLFAPQRRSLALRAEWGLGDDGLAVIHVGRIAAEKNLGLVLQAFEAIRRCQPQAKMIWVGDGPQLKRLRKQNPDHIFCGARTGVELAEHYASADLFLFPSMTETFGNVVTEAMASGLAVVAYDYAAAQTFIGTDINGVVVPYGNAQLFIDQAVTLATEPDTLRRLCMAASAAVAGHGWEQVCREFEEGLLQAVHAC